jgi:hypothetical protein
MSTRNEGRARARPTLRAVAVGLAVVAVVAACRPGHRPPRPGPAPGPNATFSEIATYTQRTTPGKVPWFCNAEGNGTPPNGHGNGAHVHPYYEDKVKGPLSWPDCLKLASELDQTMAATKGLETKGKAEAAGWRQAAPYIPGLGTHHIGMTRPPGSTPGSTPGTTPGSVPGMPGADEIARIRQCLRDKGIDLTGGAPDITNPAFIEALRACGVPFTPGMGGNVNIPFDPAKPPILIYGGKTPDAPLVGVGYMFSGSDTPPEAYTGGNDWWHLHTQACFGVDFEKIANIDPEHMTKEECEALGGTFQRLFPGQDGREGGIWLLHLWPARPYEYRPDLFVSGHPCLLKEGVAPKDDPCWQNAHRDPASGPTTTTPTTGRIPTTPTTGTTPTSPTTGPATTAPTTAPVTSPTTAAPTTAPPTTGHGHDGHGH